MLTIVIPTLNRSERLKQSLIQLAQTTTKYPTEVIVMIDESDNNAIRACVEVVMDERYQQLNLRCMKEKGHPTAISKWNAGAQASRYRKFDDTWLMLAADDLNYPAGWLEKALSTPNKGFLGLSDGREPKEFEPHYMATVQWLKEYQNGVLCVPHYTHWGVDLEIAARAHRSGTYKVAEGILPHHHVIWGTAPDDSTYRKGKETHEQDIQLFRSRQLANFPDDFKGYL